ncbi:MAG: DoxX family membrane protein [Desulfobacter sp.]|nr:MAG: DoxX family membrane protein [Desulfobacter sp.]
MVRIGLGLVFLYSGLSKSFDLNYFAGVVHAFGILPTALCFPGAVAIVTLELALGAGVILDRRGSLSGMLVMLMGFMAVAGYAIYMGYDIDCGCFGPGDPGAEAFSHLYEVLYRDAAMVAAIAYLYLWRHLNRFQPKPLMLKFYKKLN